MFILFHFIYEIISFCFGTFTLISSFVFELWYFKVCLHSASFVYIVE